MSLDFYLEATRMTTVLDRNITHNMAPMARAAGIYECLWEPEEHGYVLAVNIIPVLRDGITAMERDPARFRALDPPNGWGSYEVFLPWLKDVLRGCEENPDAMVRVSR